MSKVIALPAELTVKTVGELIDPLRAALNSGELKELNAEEIQQVDTCGVQLLISMQIAALDQGVSLKISKPSQPLATKVAAIGCEELLQFEEEEA